MTASCFALWVFGLVYEGFLLHAVRVQSDLRKLLASRCEFSLVYDGLFLHAVRFQFGLGRRSVSHLAF